MAEQPKILTLKVRAIHENHVFDSVNDTLRALAQAGDIDDEDDHGWLWQTTEYHVDHPLYDK